MKFYLIVLLAILFSFNSGKINAQSKTTHVSHVIVKIPGLTLEQFNLISAEYMKNDKIEIAYYCLESGIIALHYHHSGLSEADVQVAIKTQLQRLIKKTNIRILDVEMRSEDKNSRC